MSALALIERLHGHAGVLAAAALAHPVLLLRRGAPLGPRARWLVTLITLAVALAFGSGLWLYPSYVAQVKRELFAVSTRAGLAFETKEHLAWATALTSTSAGLASLAAPRDATALRRSAALLYAVAAALCLGTSALGLWIASIRDFPGMDGPGGAGAAQTSTPP